MDMLKQQLCTFGLVTLILTLVSLIILYSPFSHTCGLYQGHPTSIFGNICSEDDFFKIYCLPTSPRSAKAPRHTREKTSGTQGIS